jgi:hypothetical protein
MVLISGRGRILSLFQSVQTSSGALPASYSVGARRNFGAKWLLNAAEHTPLSSAKVKSAYSYTTLLSRAFLLSMQSSKHP